MSLNHHKNSIRNYLNQIAINSTIKCVSNLICVLRFVLSSLSGGKSESNANLAEGLATALVCFDDMNEIREEHRFQVQNHCILLCNSTPYSMPVMECPIYENKTIEQMAALFQEVGRSFE